jgi:general secretion pathway protein K
MRCRKGFALVITLVITALMVAVTTELIHQVYVDTSLSRGFRDGQQASLLAESGITGGTKLLQLSLSGQDYSSPSDKWAQPFKLDDETGTITITAVEESGKICLNGLVLPNGEYDSFTWEALKRLGDQLKLKDNTFLWSALADWLDSDDLQKSDGAESPYYQTLKTPYRARNGKLATLAELSLVKGFTPEVIAKIKPFVTVYAEEGGSLISKSRINVNTAPKEVLIALDKRIDEGLAARVLEERRLKPFRSVAELSRISGFDTIATGLVAYASTKGVVYRISSIAKVKETYRTVEAVIRWQDGVILSWQEY